MKTHPHRAVDLPASSPSRRAGQRLSAALVAMLAAVMLNTTAAAAGLTLKPDGAENVGLPVGVAVLIEPRTVFTYPGKESATAYLPAGTNAKFTSAVFSTMEYYDDSVTGSHLGGKYLVLKTKTTADLNAMGNPPPNPFTVTIDVTMTNDEGDTASARLYAKTTWHKAPRPGPTLSVTTQDAPPDVSSSGFADYFFSNAGAGARLTDVSFSTMDYYNATRTGLFGPFLDVTAKTSEELSAMDPPPPNPFTVQVELTMTNNAGQTGTGTVDYVTRY